jgi:hypothetical protein
MGVYLAVEVFCPFYGRSDSFFLVFIDSGCILPGLFVKLLDDKVLLFEMLVLGRVSKGYLLKMAHHGQVELSLTFKRFVL